jgi:eukaryotic-like serine/threonine-protein kinase
LGESGRRSEALAAFDRARELAEALFLAKPADAQIAHELVRTLGNMALELDGAGRQNDALAAYGRARKVLAAMEDSNPTLLAITRDRAWIDTLTADVLIRTARDAAALPLLEAARKARETLVKIDRTVVRDQTQLIRINSWIARIHARAARVSEALESYKRAAAVASEAADAHPGDVGFQAMVAAAYSDVADLHCTTGTPSEALSWSDKAMAIHRKLVKADRSQQAFLADSVRRHGIVLQKCGRPAQAVSAYREAIAVGEGLASPSPWDIYCLACSQSLLSGVAIDAGSGLTAAVGQVEADKAILSLHRAVAAGWRRPDQMRVDSDLDPLRSRPDFQMLMLDLAMPVEPFARPD